MLGFMSLQIFMFEQQLRERMHDPVPQTGQWLKSVVRGFFNYYAVPTWSCKIALFRHHRLAPR